MHFKSKPLTNSSGLAIGLFVVAISLAALGLAFVNIANHSVTIQRYSEKWQKTTASINSISVRNKKEKQYPVLDYRYSVNGKVFDNSRVFFSDGPYESVDIVENGVRVAVWPPQGKALETYTWTVGSDVEVFYNPHNPQESVLVRYALGEMKMFMILGMFAIVIGLFGVAKSVFEESSD